MKTNFRRRLGLIICLSAVSTLARSEVSESSTTSFKVKHAQTVAAKPEKAWQSLLAIDKWWSSDHTYSGSASNLRLDARAGGCFCETLPNGGSVLHMSVIFVAPNQRLTMSGGLGPLQTSGATGALTFQITPEGEGSNLTFVYEVGGYYPGGLAAIATGVDAVLGEQFARLKRLIETGDAKEKAPDAAEKKSAAPEKKPVAPEKKSPE